MQTHFSEAQKTDPAIKRADDALRKCVHCGFCNATCPTYQLTGNELEGPRGRITLIQDLLETEAVPSPQVMKSLDHCLSCLNCETTCPSGVSYRHLIDPARERIEQSGQRSFPQRMKRDTLARLLPSAQWFRRALQLARLSKPLLEFSGRFSRSAAALNKFVPKHIPSSTTHIKPGFYPAEGKEVKRVALILGCVQSVLEPEIDTATVRVLTRHGCGVVVPEKSKAGCCGALPYHLGKKQHAETMARQNLSIWDSVLRDTHTLANKTTGQTIDAVLLSASGCGSMLKDYAYLLPNNSGAELLADKVKDLSQILAELPLKIEKPPATSSGNPFIVAWQNPCSLQHGLKEQHAPINVLENCGFIVRQPEDAHLCCGSAGTYNLLQTEIAAQLGTNKIKALIDTAPNIIVSANIGCITQLSACCDQIENSSQDSKLGGKKDVEKTSAPILHLAQLIDWASGGPIPEPLLNAKVLED